MRCVLFTQRIEEVMAYGERRDCADQRIAKFIRMCGYLPFPAVNNPDIARKMAEKLCPAGIVLSGGNSLVKYGGNASERDATDRVLIDVAVESGIPLYGFCRGMQSILDYFGNELTDVTGHTAVRHRIHGDENSYEVNSYHNQGCVELVSGELKAVMWSYDGVIEKIVHKTLPVAGTMWHPEREVCFQDTDTDMLRTLFGG